MNHFFADTYPYILGYAFLPCLIVFKFPSKGLFVLRALLALGIAIALAHLNRTYNFWQEYRGFPSGHMSFCLGLSLSLGMVRRWTLAITLPLLVPLGTALVVLHYHTIWDVLGAIPMVLLVYGIVHHLWKMPVATEAPAGLPDSTSS